MPSFRTPTLLSIVNVGLWGVFVDVAESKLFAAQTCGKLESKMGNVVIGCLRDYRQYISYAMGVHACLVRYLGERSCNRRRGV